MIRIFSFLLLAISAVTLNAQFWTTAVAPSPDPATECAPFGLIIDGNKPATNYSLSSAVATVSGSTINVVVEFTASGFGLPTITPVNYSVSVPGPIPAGTYTVVVDYTAAGNMETSSWPLTVDACSSGPACSSPPVLLGDTLNPDGSVTLLWAPVDSSIACRVRGREFGSSSWKRTSPEFGTEPSSFVVPSAFIMPGTYYEWGVQCACNIAPVNTTPWSVTGLFLVPTMREGLSAEGLAPNPASNAVRIMNPEAVGQPYFLMDATGKRVASGTVNGTIDVSAYPTGLYLLQWGSEAATTLQIVH